MRHLFHSFKNTTFDNTSASGTGIAVRGSRIWIATGGATARVLHSADDGVTWKGYTTPIRSGNESSGIFSIDVVDLKTLIVVGGDYKRPSEDRDNVAKSIDGGQTWMAMPSVRMQHKACVRSLGGDRMLTCGRTGVAYSENAGETWQRLTGDGYYTLACDPESATGFLAGADGRVARFEWITR